MVDLPQGRVTFLFTDIEGSTRLLHALGNRYADVLTEHRRLLRATFARHGGVEVDTQGDSFFIAFAYAGEALAAAEESQLALAGHAWPEGEAVKVRMGVHTGEPLLTDDDHYVGIDVHRAARIAAAAHGGQVIVSARTTELVADGSRPPALRDLGAHHLKDLPEPERLFQLLVGDLPSSFPPPRAHEEAIEAAGLPDYSQPPADVPCPYKGLLPFEPEDSELFFGREDLVQDLVGRLRESGFLAVVGPSGSGKSSLVRAGVVPALQDAEDGELRTALFSPGANPLAQLAGAEGAALLVVDQFEEVFTLCRDEEERRQFIDRLLDASERGVHVVLALRADFYGHCAAHPRLASAFEGQNALIGPMTDEELRRAIERPGEHARLVLEPGVVEAILRDVAGQPGALPLLSHSLLETWKRRSGRMLTVIGYLQAGGVRGAIAKTAETVYRDALSPDQRTLARNIFLRLTELGEATEDTRRRASLAELVPRPEQAAAVDEVLQTLADARLVTIGEGTAEVAHEALIRHWPTLREWLDEDREGRLLHRRLTEAAREWDALDRDPGVLFRGARLATTGEWATLHDPDLNELEREFLTASRQAGEREAEHQRRANRRLRALLGGAGVLLVLAVIAGVVAFVQRGHARQEALKSDAERVGALAKAETTLDRRFLLAATGMQLDDRAETRGDLLSVLQATPAAFRLLRPSRNNIKALAVSHTGRLLASGDSGGAVRFYDIRNWLPSGPAVRLAGQVSQEAMAFAPRGNALAVATATDRNRSNLYLLRPPSRAARLVASWPSAPSVVGPRRFTRIAFSPDSRRLAVAVASAVPGSPIPTAQRLLLLEMPSGRVVWQRRYPLRRGQNETSVAFRPDGMLVTSAQQGETLLWSARSGRIKRRFAVGGPFGISPDGRFAALARNSPNPSDPSASLEVLDLATGQRRALTPLPAQGWIISVAFTPDGRRIVGASFEGALRVWDLASGAIVQTFAGQASGENMAVTPDGRTVFSGAETGTVVAWDLSGSQQLSQPISWNTRGQDEGCLTTPCFVINAQSTLMATSQADGSVVLIDLRTRRMIDRLPARNGPLAEALAFFPDGRRLATGGVGGRVTLWDVRARKVVRTIRFPAPVWWVAVSPDGRRLAVQSHADGHPESRVEVRDVASTRVLYSRTVMIDRGRGGLFFSPDGRRLAVLRCCRPGSPIEVWNARSGKRDLSVAVGGYAASLAFSRDGRWLAAGTNDGKVLLLDPRSGRRRGPPIEVGKDEINPVSFSPDGRLLSASSADQTATVWDLASRTRLGTSFPTVQGTVPVADFAPDGDLVIAYLADAVKWPMDPRTWERFACDVAGRDLTAGEWDDILPGRKQQRVCPP